MPDAQTDIIPHGRAVNPEGSLAGAPAGAAGAEGSAGGGGRQPTNEKGIALSDFGMYSTKEFKPEEILLPAAEKLKTRFGILGRQETQPEPAGETLKDAYKNQLRIIYSQLSGYERYVNQSGGQLTREQRDFLALYRKLGENAPDEILKTASGWMTAQTLIEQEMFLRLGTLGQEIELFVRAYGKEPSLSEERFKGLEGLITKFYNNLKDVPHGGKLLAAGSAGILAGGVLGGPLGAILAVGLEMGGTVGLTKAVSLVRSGLRETKFKFSDLTVDTAQLPAETKAYLDYLNLQKDQGDLVEFIKTSATAQTVFFEALGVAPKDLSSLYTWEGFKLGSAEMPTTEAATQNISTEWVRIRRKYLQEGLDKPETKKVFKSLKEKQENLTIAEFKAVIGRAKADLKTAGELNDYDRATTAENNLRAALKSLFRIEEQDKITEFEKTTREAANKEGYRVGSKEEQAFIAGKIQTLIANEINIRLNNERDVVNANTREQLNMAASALEKTANEQKDVVGKAASDARAMKVKVFFEAQRQTTAFFLGRQVEAIAQAKPEAINSTLSQIETEIGRRRDPGKLQEQKTRFQEQQNETISRRTIIKDRLIQIDQQLSAKAGEKERETRIVDSEKDRRGKAITITEAAEQAYNNALKEYNRMIAEKKSREEVGTQDRLVKQVLGQWQESQKAAKGYEDHVTQLAGIEAEITAFNTEKNSLASELIQVDTRREDLEKDLKREILVGEENNIFQLQAAAVCLKANGNILGKRLPDLLSTEEGLARFIDSNKEKREGFDKKEIKGYLEFLRLLFDYEHPAIPPEGSQAKPMKPEELFAEAKALISQKELNDILKDTLGLEGDDFNTVLKNMKNQVPSRVALGRVVLKLVAEIEHKALRLGK